MSSKASISLIFFSACLLCSFAARSQAPDLSRLSSYKEKVRAWGDYCESLRLNKAGEKNTYLVLQQSGLKGLLLTSSGDAEYRSRFLGYTALGYYYQIKFDSAQFYFYRSLSEAQKGNFTKGITRACVALIPVNFQLQQTDKVEECKNILQSIVDTTHDHSILEDGYYALGSYYQQKSYYSTAQDYFIKSIQLRETEADTTSDSKKKFDYAIQCDMLSKLYLNTEMVDKSLAALRKGQRFASVSPNVGNRLLSSFVEAFTTSGNIDSALFYERQLEINVGNPLSFPSEIVSSRLNIAIYYMNRRFYNQALPYIISSDTLATRTGSPLLIFQTQMIKGRYLEETGQYDPSIALLTRSLPIAHQFSRELYGNDLKYMAQAQEGKANIPGSLQYYKLYLQNLDSLTKEKLSRTFADMETHYQTNEKEQRIASLDKANRLHMLELQNASHVRLLLVLGLVALGVISLLLYFIYRNKEKLNRVLNEKNDRLDEVNQHLHEANETKARLFGIISHDLRSPVGKIVSLLQLQKERPDLFSEESRLRHEEKLKSASESVLETMEDLLLWSKSQMQSFIPEFNPVQINEVLLKEITLVHQQAEEKGIRIDCRVPDSFIRHTDENFLSVIMRNLLQNAIKYSAENKTILISAAGETLFISNSSTDATARSLNEKLLDRHVDSRGSGLGLQIAADLAARIWARLFFLEETGSTLTAVLSWERPPAV